jgi:hypothetical protein
MKVLFFASILLFCGCGQVRVVESVDRVKLDERYTIPAKEFVYNFDSLGSPMTYWTDPEVVHYEDWIVKAKDGFEIKLRRVDPKTQESISAGCRYRGSWE